MLLIKRNPLYLFLVPFWLVRGKANLQREVEARVTPNPASLPYNRAVLDWIESERNLGRSVWLCAATDRKTAESVAAHVGLFDGVICGEPGQRNSGATKAARLVGRFGARGFDYSSAARADLAVWREANDAIVVEAGSRLKSEVAQLASLARTFPPQASRLRALVKALRPHQWAKNVLILVPLLAAHRARETDAAIAALLAMLAFCLCASSVYVLNDLLDLEADRLHPRKSRRPFAAGNLPISVGLLMVPVLFGAAVAIAALLPLKFMLVFGTYYALTLAYSFVLKGRVLIDGLALAGLYTLRIIAGAAAAAVPLSFWLLLFSVFLFLSLAFVKRFAELDALRRQHRLRAAGRGYHVEDLPILQSLGTAAGYLSVLVLALYINSPDIGPLYSRPKVIWLLCVLMLYWISRVWMKAQRGTMHDDPVVFALKDRASLAVGLLAAITVAIAI
jgi:4-hydroxybenzoate polyprenyltransferase